MAHNFNFTESLNRLQDIVDIIENEDIDIDKALEFYEEGLKISNSITQNLENAEMKVYILKDKYSTENNNTENNISKQDNNERKAKNKSENTDSNKEDKKSESPIETTKKQNFDLFE